MQTKITRTCSVEGCACAHFARGWCHKHWQRWWRLGDPLTVRVRGPKLADQEARFWSHVDKKGPVPPDHPELGPCWLWTRTINEAGYGVVNWKRVDGWHTERAHRIARLLTRGLSGLELDHLCFNPPCVNPDHTREVTGAENLSARRSEKMTEGARRGAAKRSRDNAGRFS